MNKRHLKFFLRSLANQRFFSFVKLSGLAIGICVSLVAYLVVSYEYSYDTFEPGADRIYRITADIRSAGQVQKSASVPPELPKAMRKEVTGVEALADFETLYKMSVAAENDDHQMVFKSVEDVVYTGPDFFRIVPYQWLAGSPGDMNEPFRVVLTEERAGRYFPGIKPELVPGRTLLYDDTMHVTVAGVVRMPETPTDFTFGEFLSCATQDSVANHCADCVPDWYNFVGSTIVRLSPGTTPAAVERQLVALTDKYSNRKLADATYHLQPLSDLHFNADYGTFSGRVANRSTLYGLIVIAGILLLLGCINFINLTTAQALGRGKEIGIRKITGGSRAQLFLQILGETWLFTSAALIVALLLVTPVLHAFGDFLPPGLSFRPFADWRLPLFLLALVAATGLAAGYYPALVLIRFNAVDVLKNRLPGRTGRGKDGLRRTLIVAQFVVAQFFIVTTFVVNRQIAFSLSQDLGHRKNGVLVIQTPMLSGAADSIKYQLMSEIRRLAGVQSVSLSDQQPMSKWASGTTLKYRDAEYNAYCRNVDSAYFSLFRIPLIAGRTFNRASRDNHEQIINASMARALGFTDPAKAVGEHFGQSTPLPIVGVVADFYSQSFRTAIKPLVFGYDPHNQRDINVALAAADDHRSYKSLIGAIGSRFNRLYPGEPYTYSIYGDDVAALYGAEQHTATLLGWASGITYFLGCLGLLGLVVYSIRQRTKEIGIRKVFGAGISQIVTLLSKDMVRLVLLAIVIASPLAWFVMHRWLQNFAYRTTLPWWLLPYTGALCVAMAALILGIQASRAALAKPAASLRNE